MPRTLTVSRVTVPPESESEYLRAAGELARLCRGRGRRLWLFRAKDRPGVFLECSESGEAATHRAVAAPAADEARVEAHLRRLGAYDPDAWELWEEVRL
jgi:hypothetical protein